MPPQSPNEKKFFSIIVPNFNNERFVSDCLASVSKQPRELYQLIIIDGGSTDKSMETIRQFSNISDVVISEADSGQSDALNKGLANATGQYCFWLNSDDELFPGALADVQQFIQKHNFPEWVSCDTSFINEEGKTIRRTNTIQPINAIISHYPATVIGGPSAIIQTSIIKEVGGFDQRYHFIMDIDLYRRIADAGKKLVYSGLDVWKFRVHAASKTSPSLAGNQSLAHKQEITQLEAEHDYPNRFLRLGRLLTRLSKLLNKKSYRNARHNYFSGGR